MDLLIVDVIIVDVIIVDLIVDLKFMPNKSVDCCKTSCPQEE